MTTSTTAIRNPVRCFCSFAAKYIDDGVFVCSRYESDDTVCLFHLHRDNIETYLNSDKFPMALDCEQCLATIKISSKKYLAPCRVPTVHCYCGQIATFHQSKKDNSNNDAYFFGCPNWRIKSCNYFSWCEGYRGRRDVEILRRLNSPLSSSENEINSTQTRKRVLNEDDDEIRRKYQCVICLTNERSHIITPCNHLCCCSTCADQIHDKCPICRKPIDSIQRIFLV